MPRRKKTKKELSELEYNKILKDIIDAMGDKSTFLSELNGVGRKLLGVKFHGVYPSDKIPRLNDLSPYCILNLDKSNEPGSHWVALAKLENENAGTYGASTQTKFAGASVIYDSFGRDHMKIIPNLQYSGNGRIIQPEDDSEQHILEESCGQRCLAFLLFLDRYGIKNAMYI